MMTDEIPDNAEFAESLPPPPPPMQPPVYDPRVHSPSGLSIAAFVLGLLAFVGCGPCFGPPALVIGLMELQNIKNHASPQQGRAFALIGAILGGASLAFLILIVGFYVVMFAIMFLLETSGGNW